MALLLTINSNESSIYRKLADHLDRLPGGFAPSETGAEIRLLKGLFTEEEAQLAVHLTLNKETPETIGKRAKISSEIAEKRLEKMSQKGLIFSFQPEKGKILYQAAPWVIGIYEFQVNRLNKEFLKNFDDYYSSRVKRSRPETIPQMRTIPINQSIEMGLDALPYEQVQELVEAHNQFAVAPCICRRHAKMNGRGCDALEESCLIFGEFADYYVRTGKARSIDKAEVWRILEKANEDNLVLNPTNSKLISAICCCCGDCCGILNGLKHNPNPSEAASSSFIASFDQDLCINCGVCLERCQMNALSPGDYGVEFDSNRCIGCGLCTSTCPTNALTLKRKPENKIKEIPDTMYETWYTIAKKQAAINE